jgi:3-dehydroquinate synthase
VHAHYGSEIGDMPRRPDGFAHGVKVVPAGEGSKDVDTWASVIEWLAVSGANRKDALVAVGGGVVGDLGGFVASTYNRGIDLVQVPTSLLAMVDASIGGKTGIDLGGKNKTGSFYHPKCVIADPCVLTTLGEREYIEGLGEVAKYAVLDQDFMTYIEGVSDYDIADRRMDVLGELVSRCVQMKSGYVQDDPYEQNKNGGRVLLNYGHTYGHAVEAVTGYNEYLHGEAVAIGMQFALLLSKDLNILTDDSLIERQTALLQRLRLPHEIDTSLLDPNTILPEMAKDKKNTEAGNAKVRFVLPKRVGEFAVEQVDAADITQLLISLSRK